MNCRGISFVCRGFFVLTVLASVYPKSVLGDTTPGYSPIELYHLYGSAIFYVDTSPAGTSGQFTRAGTATLIDKRGYFLTASHTLALSTTDPTICNKRSPFDGIIRLTNESGLRLLGTELAGAPAGHTDLSIIKADVPAALRPTIELVSIPDLVIGNPNMIVDLPREAILIAYQYRDTTLFHPPAMGDLSIPDTPESDIVLGMKYGFNGQSGGPALTTDGRIIGVLSGPQPATCNGPIVVNDNTDLNNKSSGEALSFTQLWSDPANDILTHISTDADALSIDQQITGRSPIDLSLIKRLDEYRVNALSLEQAASELTGTPMNQVASNSPTQLVPQAAIDPALSAKFVRALTYASAHAGLYKEATLFDKYCPTADRSFTCKFETVQIYTYSAKTALNSPRGSARKKSAEKAALDNFDQLVGSHFNLDDASSPEARQLYSSAYSIQAQLLVDQPQKSSSRIGAQAVQDGGEYAWLGTQPRAEALLARAEQLDPQNTYLADAKTRINPSTPSTSIWDAIKTGIGALAIGVGVIAP
jgi:hypothetical protein